MQMNGGTEGKSVSGAVSCLPAFPVIWVPLSCPGGSQTPLTYNTEEFELV